MLQAQLKGKLTRQEEALEDLLTSDVFGSFKYVSPAEGLVPLLKRAVCEDGSMPMKDLEVASEPVYSFWPSLHEPGCYYCEPDVLIRVSNSSLGRLIVLVEAKYIAGKSSYADNSPIPNDQLAREWDNLYSVALKEKARPYLVYLTADYGFPADDVSKSIEEYNIKRPGRADPVILWTSWRLIHEELVGTGRELLKDLRLVLARRGLVPFMGIRVPDLAEVSWSFSRSYSWESVQLAKLEWQFRGQNE